MLNKLITVLSLALVSLLAAPLPLGATPDSPEAQTATTETPSDFIFQVNSGERPPSPFAKDAPRPTLEALIADLDAETYRTRQRAFEELLHRGDDAYQAVADAQKSRSVNLASQANQLMAWLSKDPIRVPLRAYGIQLQKFAQARLQSDSRLEQLRMEIATTVRSASPAADAAREYLEANVSLRAVRVAQGLAVRNRALLEQRRSALEGKQTTAAKRALSEIASAAAANDELQQKLGQDYKKAEETAQTKYAELCLQLADRQKSNLEIQYRTSASGRFLFVDLVGGTLDYNAVVGEGLPQSAVRMHGLTPVAVEFESPTKLQDWKESTLVFKPRIALSLQTLQTSVHYEVTLKSDSNRVQISAEEAAALLHPLLDTTMPE